MLSSSPRTAAALTTPGCVGRLKSAGAFSDAAASARLIQLSWRRRWSTSTRCRSAAESFRPPVNVWYAFRSAEEQRRTDRQQVGVAGADPLPVELPEAL